MACLESAAFALATSGRLVEAAQLHLGGALCRDDRVLDMTKVVENSSSQVIQPVFTYRPTKIQPSSKAITEITTFLTKGLNTTHYIVQS